MYVENIQLFNFRNFSELNLKLNKGINIFYGDNAQGKTNFLESIYLCGTGKSHRTNFEKELIMFKKEDAYVKSIIVNELTTHKIEFHLKNNNKKGIAIDSVPIKKLGDLFGILFVVIFSPEDLDLVKSGPSFRRKFMDIELCQLSYVYYFNLQQYYKVLQQRNNLLKSLQKNKSLLDTLEVWDLQLADYGEKIINYRKDFINKLKNIAEKYYFKISGEKELLNIVYKPNVSVNDYKDKMHKNWDRDIYTGTTNVGIHKDDINFFVNSIDIRIFGSQGQQRTCSLAAKLAQVDIIKEEKNDSPVLLLDDVLSELDTNRQNFLLKNLIDIQTIITCADASNFIQKISKECNLFRVENGRITSENPKNMI